MPMSICQADYLIVYFCAGTPKDVLMGGGQKERDFATTLHPRAFGLATVFSIFMRIGGGILVVVIPRLHDWRMAPAFPKFGCYYSIVQF